MRLTPAVKVILIINIVFYALTYWITPMVSLDGHADWFENFNALHPVNSPGFNIFQYVTYMFMHGGWWHLFFNMWSLWLFGPAVEMQVGTKRFTCYYLLCGIGAALANQAMSLFGIIPPSLLVGASGAIYGLMAAAAYYFPHTKLFIIPIPVPIKLKYLVAFYTVFEMYQGITTIDGVAHFAHFGGIVAGSIILVIWKLQERKQQRNYNSWGGSTWGGNNYTSSSSNYDKGTDNSSVFSRLFNKKREPKMTVHSVREVNYADHMYNQRKAAERAEIDRILDKVRQSGYQSLTEKEKTLLFDASKSMQEKK